VFECNETIPDVLMLEYRKSKLHIRNVKAYLPNYESSLINGCGYNKTDKAISEVLNKCTPILKKLYDTNELTKVDCLPSFFEESYERTLGKLNMSLVPTIETKLVIVFKLVKNV